MSPDKNNEPIKITLDDLARVETTAPAGPLPIPGKGASGAKVYGSVTDAADQRVETTPEERGSIFLQAWFYLGIAGLLGALLAWVLAEPAFVDGEGHRWGNIWMMPMVVTFQCVGFAISESLVERSAKKAVVRGLLALPLGVILAFIFDFAAGIIFRIGLAIAAGAGVQTFRNPAFWVVRGIAWMVFGAAGGVVYGIVGQSSKKTQYGVLGGVIGAGIGGMIFDPIAMLTKGGAASRAVGFALLGIATGIAIGLVESALKDRWLYVTAGPLAGKQFILYKPRTVIGSDQKCDIYLFKDLNVLPEHAIVEIAGTRVQLRALGPSYVSGQPARIQVLQSGNSVQIGRYAFRYSERQRK
jgi:Inner membrane component of T3SS, cytoplasmic domain